MCGISGFWGPRADRRVRNMIAALRHRGPDGEGQWSRGDLAIGHTRLAIQDLSEHGRQPMTTRDESVVISVNGEIYNYPELRRELESRGARFSSKCDSEVVLHAWQAWGYGAFSRLNGMFAIALYDVASGTLLLARDRLGIKPLYYTRREEGFAFASEIKGLFSAFDSRRWDIDWRGFAQYMVFGNTFGSTSFFSSVALLPPAVVLTVTREGMSTRRFWTASSSQIDQERDLGEAAHAWRRTLEASVERHLLSDVPVASYLSAGFDSASVAVQAGRLGPAPPVCFTGSFPEGGWYDETTVASRIAEANGSRHVAVTIHAEDVPAALDKLLWALDEPRMGMGALPQYLVAQRVAETHKVVLTGHGGDELFSGYPVFKVARLLDALDERFPRGILELARFRASELPQLAYFALNRFGPLERRQFLPVLHSWAVVQRALQPTLADTVSQLAPWAPLEGLSAAQDSMADAVFATYLKTYLHGLLVVEDRISMAHGLESRTPLLDNAMLDLSLLVPQAVKMHDGRLKAVVRTGAEGFLPRELYAQPKRGFPTPLRAWLRGPLRELTLMRIAGKNSRLGRVFKHEWLRRVANTYMNSPYRRVRVLDEIQSHRIWQLLCLESWLRQCEESWNIEVLGR